MNRSTFRHNLSLAISAVFAASVFVCVASLAAANTTGAVKCGVNQDRVWVYDSLTSLNVEAKLKCGDSVEILGQAPGYIKVRTIEGQEGYVSDDSLPNAIAVEANSAGSTQTQGNAPESLGEWAARFRAKTAAVTPKPNAQASGNAAQSAATKAQSATNGVTAHANFPTVTSSPPAINSVAKSIFVNPAPPKPPISASIAPGRPAASGAPAQLPAVSPLPSNSQIASPAAASTQAQRAAIPAPPQSNAVAYVSAQPAPVQVATPSIPANTLPVADANPAPGVSDQTLQHVTLSPHGDLDADDDADEVPAIAEPHPKCAAYFSAYGVTPNQFEWIQRNLTKSYPGVCPAPLPDMVDFVVIFTHDVNFYNYTMPAAVHVSDGFSDWEPIQMVDSALVSRSAADKNKREYVWVFRVRRGAFDPGSFSSRRRPQFTKIESNTFGYHASDRTLEDALRFIQREGAAAR